MNIDGLTPETIKAYDIALYVSTVAKDVSITEDELATIRVLIAMAKESGRFKEKDATVIYSERIANAADTALHSKDDDDRATAYLTIGDYLAYGFPSISSNYALAQKWYQKCLDTKSTPSYRAYISYKKGLQALYANNGYMFYTTPEKSVIHLRTDPRSGRPDWVNEAYPQDRLGAVEHFKDSIREHYDPYSTNAKFELGILYNDGGGGVEKNFAEVRLLMEDVLSQGIGKNEEIYYPLAQQYLANALQASDTASAFDLKRAVALYKEAAESYLGEGQEGLAMMLFANAAQVIRKTGDDRTFDYQEAEQLFLKVINSDATFERVLLSSKCGLSAIYFNNHPGVKKNRKKSVQLAKEVRDFDDKGDQQERLTKAWSCELLALLAVTRPVIPDYISALSYCDEAIELGGVDAFPLKMRIEQHAANKAKDIGKSFIENVLTRL